MKNLAKWMLGAVVLAGGLGLGATSAQAAQLRVYVGGGASAYIPPCPGPGYAWVDGYYNDGYWVPGYWNYVGAVGYGYGRDGYYRHFDRDDDRGWDHDRGFYGRDHDRGFYGQDRGFYGRGHDDHRFDRDRH